MSEPVSPWQTSLQMFAARYAGRIAVASRGRTLTYAQLAAQANAVRAAVIEAGAKPGEPVAILARNGPGVVIAGYGVMASGAAEFVVDLNLGPDDLAYAMRIMGVRCAVAERAEVHRVASLGLDVMVLEDLIARPAGAVASPPFDPHAWGKAIMTSGTTGRPKAIIHRHDRRWYAHVLLRAHLPFVPGANDRVLLMTAYAHGAALVTAAWLESGASVELIDGVDVAYADELFAGARITAVFAPPTVLAKLVDGTRHKRIDGIKCVFCGTATCSPRSSTRHPRCSGLSSASPMANPKCSIRSPCSKWRRRWCITAISPPWMLSASARPPQVSRWWCATRTASAAPASTARSTCAARI